MHAIRDLVRELDGDLLQPRRREPGHVLRSRQRAGDAADVAASLRALVPGDPVLRDDVADAEAATALQDAGCLGKHRGLVERQVDDAVRDDDVDGLVRKRDSLDLPLRKCAFATPAAWALARARSSISSVMSRP
jgi:hypothetical protein